MSPMRARILHTYYVYVLCYIYTHFHYKADLDKLGITKCCCIDFPSFYYTFRMNYFCNVSPIQRHALTKGNECKDVGMRIFWYGTFFSLNMMHIFCWYVLYKIFTLSYIWAGALMMEYLGIKYKKMYNIQPIYKRLISLSLVFIWIHLNA